MLAKGGFLLVSWPYRARKTRAARGFLNLDRQIHSTKLCGRVEANDLKHRTKKTHAERGRNEGIGQSEPEQAPRLRLGSNSSKRRMSLLGNLLWAVGHIATV
jgi:hypothetical protein